MVETTLGILEKYHDAWKNNAGFDRTVKEVREGTGAIRGRSDVQQTPTEGITGDKAQIRDDLEEKLLVIADTIAAFADETADKDLAAKVAITKASLDVMSASDLVRVARRVIGAAEDHLAALALYEVTPEKKDELKAVSDLFANKKESPRKAIIDRSVETQSLPGDIRSLRSVLRNRLDKLMTGFKKSHPDFYKAYFAARIVIDRAATIPPKEGPGPSSPPPKP
jgi:hypothetical protein